MSSCHVNHHHFLTSAWSVLHMCNSQQIWEESEMAHSLGTFIISSVENNVLNTFLPLARKIYEAEVTFYLLWSRGQSLLLSPDAGFVKRGAKEWKLLLREAGISRDCVGMAKTAAVKLNSGSWPPILPTSGNEQILWHALWKKRWNNRSLPCT